KFPRAAERLRPILDAHGHALVSGWYSCELLERDVPAEMQAVADHAVLLRDMGCGVIIVCETSNTIQGQRGTPLSARPVLETTRWAEFGRRLTEFAERLKEVYGLQLVYHHHMGTVVQTEAEIDRLMAMTGPALDLLLDTGHVTWGGGDPERVARHYRDRIGHVHCKDVREEVMWQSQREDWSFLDSVLAGVYTVPGDGFIDYVSVFRALPGYSGWVVVEAEQDPEKAEPAKYARMGHDNVSRFLKEAGLT
ncbi:MAG TPA: myo-inosose-2 dehydratase, partial [Hyphomicrobiales bacterium]